MDDKVKKLRSPQFPFIPLEKAVERAREFETVYHHHSARTANAVKTWNYGEKSSGGQQTIGALCAYGLLDDDGELENRKLRLTSLAMTILKDSRPGAAEGALKAAALKPRAIRELWEEWQAHRPPDHECISTLHLDKGFTQDAAERFLKVYDATIGYAKLADDDKVLTDAVAGVLADSNTPPQTEDKGRLDVPPPAVPPAPKPQVHLMTGERVVFAHELKPDQGFRVVVSGQVDAAMLEAIEAFAKFQKMLLKGANAPKPADEQAH